MSEPYIYYQDEWTTLWHGRTEEVLPRLGPIGALCSDPPYGINHPTNYRSRGRDKLAACTDYPTIQGDNKPFNPAFLLALNVPTILWGGNHYASRLPDSSGWLVWDKERPDTLDQSTCELAWTNCVKGVRRFRYLWNGAMRAGNETLVHPMQKPLALMRWCLNFIGDKGIVVDPYCGSGPVLRAAKDLGIKAIGIDVEEWCCELTVSRLAQSVIDFEPVEEGREAIAGASLFTD